MINYIKAVLTNCAIVKFIAILIVYYVKVEYDSILNKKKCKIN